MVDRVYERNASDSAPQPPADPSLGYPNAGNPAQGVPATLPGPYWYHMITESLRRVVLEAGLTPDHEDLDQVVESLQAMGVGTGQFQKYSSLRIYETGEVARGSDGKFYEFYDRDGDGTVQDVDPTDSAARPHIWMVWDGVKPGTTIAWRSETLPEGYLPNDGWQSVPRQDYRRIFDAFGTTWGEGDGETTFGMPGDEDEFLRGWDPNGSRGLAEHQMDSLQDHGHFVREAIYPDVGTNSEHSPSVRRPRLDLSGLVSEDLRVRAADLGETGGGTPRVDSETRGRNTAAIWLTKI